MRVGGWLALFLFFFACRGKTEHEIMKEEPQQNVEPFNRVSSKRFSERVLKGTAKIFSGFAFTTQ